MKKDNLSNGVHTDLHTHILPAVDDGARNLETALEMLRLQKKNGVQRLVLTPHLYLQNEDAQTFLKRRQQAYQTLLDNWQADTMPELRLGAEVRYAPQLVDLDLREMTLGQSDYLLLELPNMEVPFYIEQVLGQILCQGITPILAHVERCSYFRVEPQRLKRLVDIGALAQVTARAINDKKDQRFAKSCLEKGLAHIVASDMHVLAEDACLGHIARQLDEALVKRAEEFALCIWNNEYPPAFCVRSIQKGFFGYS